MWTPTSDSCVRAVTARKTENVTIWELQVWLWRCESCRGEAPSSAWSKLGPVLPGPVGWIALLRRIKHKMLCLKSNYKRLPPYPVISHEPWSQAGMGQLCCVFDNNRPSITSGQQPTTATGPPSYKLNFDKRLTRGRVAWENYSPIWNWSPIILSAGAFRLGLSEDTTDRRQLSVLDWNWRGVTSTERRPSSLSAGGYLTAANELLPIQELHQAAAPGPRSLLSLVTGSEQVLLASLPVSGCQTTMPVNLRIHWGNQTWKERAGDWWCLKTTALIPLGF